MSLSSLSVRRAVTISMVYVAILGFGIFNYLQLPRDLFPDIDFPIVIVATTYVGAGPEDVEQLVTRPIEAAVASVEGVEEITSRSRYGLSLVLLEFDWSADMFKAETDVRKNLELFATSLPEDAQKPIVFAFDPSLQPVLMLGVTGPYGPAELRKIAEDRLAPLLERIPGVASTDTGGGLKREIHVELNPERLRALMVAPVQVVQAITQANLQLPAGSIRQGGQLLSINAQGRFIKVEEISEVIVSYRAGREVRVKDVAEVKDWFQEVGRIVRNNGRSAVMTFIRKQSDANSLLVSNAVLKALPSIEATLPQGIKINVLFDQGDIIKRSLGNVEQTAVQAFILAFVVLFLFLFSFSSAVIVSLAIPISLLFTFPGMKATGVSLNIISMTGLALAIGMLVDNAVVVVENIYRHLELGKTPREAAVDGTQEVGMAITASTLTTLAVFFPVIFVPGISGVLFRDMVITICLSLLASLIVARTLIPMAASRLLASPEELERRRVERSLLVKILFAPATLLSLILRPLSIAIQWLLKEVTRFYGGFLRVCLNWRKTTLIAALAAFVASVMLLISLGMDFMPATDNGRIELELTGASGNNVEFTDKLARELEEIVKKEVPEAELISLDIGTGEGIGAVFGAGEYSGRLRIRLPRLNKSLFGKGTGRKRRQQEIEASLRKKTDMIPGLEVRPNVAGFGGGDGDIVVYLFIEDLVQARAVGEKVRDALKKIDGLEDVRFSMEDTSPEFKLHLDRKRLSQLGTNPGLVTSTVSTYFMGARAGVFQEGADEYDIIVRVPEKIRKDVERVKNVPIFLATGAVMPLAAVASVSDTVAPSQIERRGQRRVVKVSCTKGDRPLDVLRREVEQTMKTISLPDDAIYTVGGTAEDQQEAAKYMAIAFLAAILLVYMVMASQFESLLEPFVILFTVPLAIIGVALSLYLTKTTLSLTALIGLVMLAGIVVNNAIVLIDYLKQQWDGRWATLIDTTIVAGKTRLRPILLTSLTTILAMVPMALGLGEGGETWAPMARSVIGGLTMSTILTLVVVPAWYVLIAGWRARRRERREARREARRAAAAATTSQG